MGGTSTVSLFYEPTRILDTRSSARFPSMKDGYEYAIEIGGQTFGNDTVPTTATGIIANLTVAGPSGDGYLVVYAPDAPANPPPPVPPTSNINFTAGGPPLANTLISRMGPGGQQFANNGIVVRAVVTGGGQVDVIIDLIGYLD
jgi:hypothetical protein